MKADYWDFENSRLKLQKSEENLLAQQTENARLLDQSARRTLKFVAFQKVFAQVKIKVLSAKRKLLKARKKIEITISQNSMLKTLCLDLLNLAQMESKSLSLNLGFFDLNALIKKVFDLVHYEAKSRNV